MIIIIGSSLIGNRLFTNQLNNSIKRSNEKILSLTSHNFQFMHNSVESFLLRLSNDVKVNQLINTEVTRDNSLDIWRLMDLMTGYKDNMEFVHSFYMYNANTDAFYVVGSSNAYRVAEDMEDLEIRDIIKSISPESVRITVKPRVIEKVRFHSDINADVYTYIFTNFDYETGELERAYVVNVNAEWFIESIHNMTDENLDNESTLIVVQKDGTVMAHSDDDYYDSSIINEAFFTEVMNQTDDKGAIEFQIDNKEHIVSYNHLRVEGIVLINYSAKDQVYAGIRVINSFTIIIMLGFLVIGLIISFILSKVFYKPILNLKSNLQMLFDADGHSHMEGNEFYVMQSMFEDVHQDLVTLQSFKTKNMRSLKTQFLFNILSKKIISMDEVEKKCQNLEFMVDVSKRMQLLHITVDGYTKMDTSNNANAVIVQIEEIIAEKLSHLYDFEIMEGEYHHIVLMNIPVGQALSVNDEDTTSLLGILQENVRVLTGRTITVTVSPIIRSLADIHSVYELLKLLAQRKLITGYESIIFNDEGLVDKEDFKLPVDMTKAMLGHLKAQEMDKCLQKCNQIFASLKKYEIDDVRLAISYLSLSIIDTINMMKSNAKLSFEIDLKEWNNLVFNIETLDEINQLFGDTMSKVMEQMKESKKSRSNDLVDAIKKYIDENYDDYSMTPNLIAKSQGLSLKYANTLFKKDTGISIASFINDYRLERAAKLLTESKSSVEHILDKVGWENQSYFFTLFKKKYGVTPTIYRANQ